MRPRYKPAVVIVDSVPTPPHAWSPAIARVAQKYIKLVSVDGTLVPVTPIRLSGVMLGVVGDLFTSTLQILTTPGTTTLTADSRAAIGQFECWGGGAGGGGGTTTAAGGAGGGGGAGGQAFSTAVTGVAGATIVCVVGSRGTGGTNGVRLAGGGFNSSIAMSGISTLVGTGGQVGQNADAGFFGGPGGAASGGATTNKAGGTGTTGGGGAGSVGGGTGVAGNISGDGGPYGTGGGSAPNSPGGNGQNGACVVFLY
jgi:hypothetical protein